MKTHIEDLNVHKILQPSCGIGPNPLVVGVFSYFDSSGVTEEGGFESSGLRFVYNTQSGNFQKYDPDKPDSSFSVLYVDKKEQDGIEQLRFQGPNKEGKGPLPLENITDDEVRVRRINQDSELPLGGYGGDYEVMGSKPGDYVVAEYVRKANIILAHKDLIDANPREILQNKNDKGE